jgi:hypothetical protein
MALRSGIGRSPEYTNHPFRSLARGVGSNPTLFTQPPGLPYRVWCSGNIDDSHSSARGSTPRIRDLLLRHAYLLFVLTALQ